LKDWTGFTDTDQDIRMIKAARLGLLAEALQTETRFAGRGYTVAQTSDSLLVERDGHFRGIWTAMENRYVWTAAGYSQPSFATGSLPEALEYTLTLLSKR
jgi:hypothetical protein